MKKIILAVFVILTTIMLSSCLKIATPEELLVSPALNQEKREMKEAVDNFRPPNSASYPVIMSDSDRSMSMIISDLDLDSSSEIISFYKSKVDDKIGMFILKKVDNIWVKKDDIKFNTYEISEFMIEDLNGNGKKELIVESYEPENTLNPRNYSIIYFDNKEVKVIKEIPNMIIEIADINSDGRKEIFSITKNLSDLDYVLNIDEFDGSKIVNYRKKVLKDIKKPYNISIGKIFDEQMAIFIDYIGDNKYENTDILLFNKNRKVLTDMRDIQEFNKGNYQFNVQSQDVDNDGIIEVGYKFKAPNYSVSIQDTKEGGLINGYFKIKKDYKLELVKEVYENIKLGYVMNIPKLFTGKYTINENDMNTNINFINHLGKEYPLIQINYIKKYEWQQDNELRNSMQLITENQDYVIAGKVLDYSDSLDDKERESYLQMRSSVQILSNVIKERLYK